MVTLATPRTAGIGITCTSCGCSLTAASKHRDTTNASGRMYCRRCLDALNGRRRGVRSKHHLRAPCIDGTQAHHFVLPWPHNVPVPCARGCGVLCEPPHVLWEVD